MTKTWTKNDLVEKIQMEIGISLSDSSKIFEEITEEILSSLEHGNDVKISNFGTFSVKRKSLDLVEIQKLEMKKKLLQEMLFHFIRQKQ